MMNKYAIKESDQTMTSPTIQGIQGLPTNYSEVSEHQLLVG
jgi:hypothetical protein